MLDRGDIGLMICALMRWLRVAEARGNDRMATALREAIEDLERGRRPGRERRDKAA